MRRRSLLTALTAGTVGLAGCSFRWGPEDGDAPPGTADGDPDQTPSRTTTTREPVDGGEIDGPVRAPGGRVVDVDGGPRTIAIDPRTVRYADRVRAAVGLSAPVEAPTRLEVLVQNVRDHDVVVETERLPVVGRPFAGLDDAETDVPGLALPPTETNELAERTPDVERGPEGYWRVADDVAETAPYPRQLRLRPGERARADCHVVGPPDTATRPTGTYRNVWSGGTVALHVWHSERPGPTAASRFGDRSVPSPGDDDTTVTWYHEAGPETTAYLVPSTERRELPGSVTATAVNHTRTAVGCGYWRLYKLVGDAYYDLNPQVRTDACRQLSPGQRSTYGLLAFPDDPVGDDADARVVGNLGGGTYAVVSGYAPQGEAVGALVDLDGPPVEIRPTDDVIAGGDGESVTVSDPRREADDAEPALAVLSRIDADVERRLIPEQVGQPWNRALRNTLPYVDEEVDRVVLETSLAVLARAVEFGVDDYQFAYRGDAYQLTVDRQG